MSRGRLTFNLQSTEQMEELRKLLGGKYVKRTKGNAEGVEADEEHRTSVRHLRPSSGDSQ